VSPPELELERERAVGAGLLKTGTTDISDELRKFIKLILTRLNSNAPAAASPRRYTHSASG
jgi:hypothetical protein